MRIIECNFADHGTAIQSIFNEAIVHSTALYDYQPRSLETIENWFSQKALQRFPVIGLITDNNQLAGFASYGTFRAWPAYQYTVEHSIYIHQDFRGQGLGKCLLAALIEYAEKQNYHVLIAAIDSSNQNSIKLHQSFGFSHAGTLKQVGFKFGRWLDVELYQKILLTPENPNECP